MNAGQVLTVMRDHTGIREGVGGGGRLCVCGQASYTAYDHTAHVAAMVADAVAEQLRLMATHRAGRHRATLSLPVAQLHVGHLAQPVTVTGFQSTGNVVQLSGVLTDVRPDGDTTTLLQLLPEDGHHVLTLRLDNARTWVQVHP